MSGLPRRQLVRGDVDVKSPGCDVEDHIVAASNQRERTAGSGLGRHMEHHRAVCGSAHSAVTDANHIAHALTQEFGRQGHVGHLRHARIPPRAAPAHHQDRVGVDVEFGVVDPRVHVLDGVEHHGAAAMVEEVGRRRRGLDHRSVRSEISVENCDTGMGLERLAARPDDLPVPDGSINNVVDQRLAGHRERSWIEEVADLGQHGMEPAGTEEVLHEEASGRLQVREQRNLRAGGVEVVLDQVDAEPPRDREEMHHRIGRAADRSQRDDGVEE